MKKILLLLTIILFTQCRGEEHVVNQQGKPRQELHNDSLIIHKTINSEPLKVKTETNKDTKIVIVKEDSPEDYSKYIIAFISILFGFFLNKLSDYWIEKKKVKKAGDRWVIELQGLKEPLDSQIESLNELKTQLQSGVWEYSALGVVPTVNGDVFKSLEINDLAKYIKGKNSIRWFKFPNESQKQENYTASVKKLNKVQNLLNYLSFQYKLMLEKWDSFQDGVSKTTAIYNECLGDLVNSMTEFGFELRKNGINIPEDGRYNKLFDLYISFTNDLNQFENYNPLESDELFFTPFIKLLEPLGGDERLVKVANSITSCRRALKAAKAERGYMISILNDLIERYQYPLKRLTTVVDNVLGKKTEDE